MTNTDFQTHQFPNGFRLALQKTQTNTIFCNLRIDHGALHEKAGEEGTAHFLEHMFIEGGTEKYSPEQQAKIRSNLGFSNANTSRNTTNIPAGIIPSSLEDYLDFASEMVFRPRLDEKILEQQKKIVQLEIARTKGTAHFEDMFKFYRPALARDRDHTYSVLGNEEVIQNLNEPKIRDFHKRGYGPNNMILMLAGDLPLDIIKRVENYFADEPTGEGKPFNFSPVSILTERKIRHTKALDLINKDNPLKSNSELRLGFIVPDEHHPDNSNLAIASEILGKSKTTGLYKRIRSEEGMAYQIGSTYLGMHKMGYFEVYGKVDAKRQEQAINIIFEEIGKLKELRLVEEEIDSAKKRVAYKMANAISENYVSFLEIDPINVQAIGKMDYEFEGRPPIKEKLAGLDMVTPSTLQKAAAQYLISSREKDNYVLLIRDPLKV